MKKRVFETNKRFSRYRLIFFIFVILWILSLDALILDKINDNLESHNLITGNTVRPFDQQSYEKDISVMVLFDILIIGSFTMSYISWEDKRKRLAKK